MAGEKRRRRIRKKKRMPAPLRMGVLITVLVMIVAAAGIMMAPVFNITEVYCEGCNNVKTEDVIAAAQIENGTHILLANIGKARRQVEDNPLVKDVSVRRIFPDKICITVAERIPTGYVMRGAECYITDSEGVVLEIINDSRSAMIVKENTPEPKEENKQENKEGKSDSEKEDGDDKKTKEEPEDSEDSENTENQENSEEITKPYDIPLVAGFECEATEIGGKLKATDEGKFNKAMEILNALRNAQLLERTTYVDVTDMTDIRVVVENRLDVYIGTGGNIDYRAKFLAEVINTKISSYEKVVMDYRGDDVFVRPPEDGKDRIYKVKEEEKSSEDGEETDSESEEKSEEDKKSDKKSDDESEEASDRDENESKKASDNEKSDKDAEEDAEDNAEKSQTKMTLDE